mgnify:CR=1 FL=1
MSWETLTNNNKKKQEQTDDGSDKLFATVFNGPNGEKALSYLEAITGNVFANPQNSSNNLWHLEGQRFLVGIIKNKIKKGRENG